MLELLERGAVKAFHLIFSPDLYIFALVKNDMDMLCRDYIRKSSAYKALSSTMKGDIEADGLSNYPLSRLISLFYEKRGGRLFAIAPTEDDSKSLSEDLRDCGHEVILFPSSGKQLYSPFTGTDGEYAQKKALEEIIAAKSAIVVASLRAFVSPVLSQKAIEDMTIKITIKDAYEPGKLIERLSEAGYYRSPSCYEVGSFSIRGEVLDIFPFSFENPIRIYTEWDEVVRIREYEALTQKAIKDLRQVSIPSIQREEGVGFTTFLDYVSDRDFFCFLGEERLATSHSSLQKEAVARYKESYKEYGTLPSPEKMLLPWESFHAGRHPSFRLFDIQTEGRHHFSVTQSRSYFGNVKYFREDAEALLANEWRIIIVAPTVVQKERLDSVLGTLGVPIVVKEISSGFQIESENLLVVLDNEIFGRKKQKARKVVDTISSPLDSFIELKPGDYVVHVNYGIGRFEKIDRVKGFNTERDYIKIEYADKEYLFVPIEQADLVQKYIGNDGRPPKLDSMGSSSWTKKKEKAVKSAQKLAGELVRLYAERSSVDGHPFGHDTDWQLEFEAAFPYTETPDQITCLEDVKKDMEDKKVMDRLICGDVGFGKTEIAFRAAFKAVMDSKQVAFLAPTVILAEQHYENFKERLGNFPVKAGILTRFTTPAQQRKVKEDLRNGRLDVLFGTHKILRNTEFKDLGLLVVDEEQRFGVKDKERIKQLKTNIDCLTLSATPIPRTLYMSLLKVRDMSLLTTAPRERQSVETYIEQYDEDVAIAAIKKELDRGGQVFYLHNRIDDLEDIARMIKLRIPSAIVEFAHGQMEAEELEDKMHRFIYEGVQVLVSTTIIENGINIPNVNTIVIDRAERFGLAQLYQLRGRVGRSDRKAYCHLFYPDRTSLNDDAIKRLRVMSENTALGSGFKIAMKDMEFRGAGNILGREQSGHLEAVGLDLYMKLLDEEINRLQQENPEVRREVLLELEYTGFIPDSYIKEPQLKFEVYKKIASVDSVERLESLRSELDDRFGPIPEEVDNLLCIAEIKIICRKLDIYHMVERNGRIEMEFSKVASIDPGKVVRLIKLSNENVSIDPKRVNYLTLRTNSVSLKDKALFILEQLRRLL